MASLGQHFSQDIQVTDSGLYEESSRRMSLNVPVGH